MSRPRCASGVPVRTVQSRLKRGTRAAAGPAGAPRSGSVGRVWRERRYCLKRPHYCPGLVE